MPMIYTPAHINSEFLSGYVHRRTLPQSRIRSTAPSGREPGKRPPQCQSPARWMLCQRAGDFWGSCVGGYILPFNRVLAKPQRCGRFSSPLRNSEWLTAPIHRTTLPQSALAGCQLPQRGSRGGFHHSPDCSLKTNVAGDFHRPYGGLRHSSGGTKVQQKTPRGKPGGWEYYQSVT